MLSQVLITSLLVVLAVVSFWGYIRYRDAVCLTAFIGAIVLLGIRLAMAS